MKRLIVAFSIVLAVAPSVTEAKTWLVKADGTGDAPTIQAAVNSAVSGDVILVEAGVYHEVDILVDGKNLMIDQTGVGRAYLVAPPPGGGAGMIIRNVTAAFSLNSLFFSGYETGVSIENGSLRVNWITVKACSTGIGVTGATSSPVASYTLVDSCSSGVEVQGGAAVTLTNETIVNCTVGVHILSGSAALSYSILSACSTGVDCAGGTATLTCNDFWKNAADFAGCSAGQQNFFDDPIFCFLTPPSPDLYWVHDTSPCWTKANPCGKLIGAFVSRYGCTGAAVGNATWGAIKGMYR